MSLRSNILICPSLRDRIRAKMGEICRQILIPRLLGWTCLIENFLELRHPLSHFCKSQALPLKLLYERLLELIWILHLVLNYILNLLNEILDALSLVQIAERLIAKVSNCLGFFLVCGTVLLSLSVTSRLQTVLPLLGHGHHFSLLGDSSRGMGRRWLLQSTLDLLPRD